jgi:hypothetical protein
MRTFVTEVRNFLTSVRASPPGVPVAVTEVATAPPRFGSPAPK